MRRSSRPQRAAAHCLARAGLLRAECWRTFHALPLACRVAPNASPRPGLILMPQVRTEGDFSLSVDSSDQVSRFFSAQHLCCQPDAAACSLLVALDSQMRSAFHAPALLMCVVICGCLYSCVQCRRLACTAVRSAGAWRVQLCAVPAPGVYSCVQCRRLACTAVRSAGAWLVQPCAVPAPAHLLGPPEGHSAYSGSCTDLLQVWVLGQSPEFGHCKATKKASPSWDTRRRRLGCG